MFFLLSTVILFLLLAFATYAALTNPYNALNIVAQPFVTIVKDDLVVLSKVGNLKIHSSLFARILAWAKCGWHIFAHVYVGDRGARGDIHAITAAIHQKRFDPRKPYLITGGHFSVLYPRNLGVFYHSILDSRTALDQKDWENRQRIYLQTVAYALETFRQLRKCATTIVPLGRKSVTCINIYHYPSDALYGLLYGLARLIDNSEIFDLYPFEGEKLQLQTNAAATPLLSEYRDTLEVLIERYVQKVFDTNTGLIREDVRLSSAKDTVIRRGAFYDNVIFWKTLKLARELDIAAPATDLAALKARIIESYWNEEKGFFVEDLSHIRSAELSIPSLDARSGERGYSADWLVVLFTGFLNCKSEHERIYIKRSIDYTIQHRIDEPFPLRYEEREMRSRLIPLVRFLAPSYQGESIWSFWGAEYIKALTLLGKHEGKRDYIDRAEHYLEIYKQNVISFGGYPEVYTENGLPLHAFFYRSVRATGWIVGFEQAAGLLAEAERNR